MPGICGWLSSDRLADKSRGAAQLEAMSGHLGASNKNNASEIAADAGLAFRSGSSKAALLGKDTLLVAIDGQPRWTDPFLAALASEEGHAVALSRAYAQEGFELLAGLEGEFSLAILDLQKHIALLAVDRMGRGRLYFSEPENGCLIFGSTADSVAAHPSVTSTISEQGIFDYLFLYYSPAPQTIYKEQNKLMAGQYLLFDGASSKTHFYWHMPYDVKSRASSAELAEGLRTKLRASVERIVSNEKLDRVGAFLSGGLDSSTTAGLLNEQGPAPSKCFTIGFDEPGYDEMEFAAKVASHFGVDHTPYYMTNDDLIDVIPRLVAAYDEPFGNSSAIPTYLCARVAREHGIETMIAGDGGDELFAGNERYVAYDIYERYNRLPHALRKGLVEPATTFLSSLMENSILRKGRNFLRTANTPFPDRVFMLNAFSAESIKATYGTMNAIFESDFIATVNPEHPIEGMREIHNRTSSTDPVQRLMHLDLQRTLADNDLNKVGRMCELAGVAVRYPFLDDDLVSFSATIPSAVLLENGDLRRFYKNAFQDFLPASTINKSKHGFGLPTTEWMRANEKMREMVYAAFDSFTSRGILKKSFCTEIVENLMENKSRYLADSAWDILILELWLQKRGFKA